MHSWVQCCRGTRFARQLRFGWIGATALLVLLVAGASDAEARPGRRMAGAFMGHHGKAGAGIARRFAEDGMHRRDRPTDDGQDNRPGNSDGGDNRQPPRPGDGRPAGAPGRDGRNPFSFHAVCIAGRMREGRCECGPRDGGQRVGDNAFACGSQRIPVTPSIAPRVLGGVGPSSPLPDPTPNSALRLPPGPGRSQMFVPDEVIVSVTSTVPETADDVVGQSYDLQILERSTIPSLDRRLVRYRVPYGRSLTRVLSEMQSDPRVLALQPNYYYRHQQGSPPADNGLQYALVKLDVARAQAIALGSGARIAIIDSGIDQTHPDLSGSVVETFPGSGTGTETHGTEVSGIIAAHGTVRGVAPEAKLLDVRVFAPGHDGQAMATSFNVVRGIDWALSKHAHILNMSFAGPRDSLLEASIRAAAGRGAITVAAAGNGGPLAAPAYPAAYPGVIAVTATDFADRLYSLANRGGYISVAAPGVDVLAPSGDHAHQLLSGTSYAAAYVSGIVALMVERDPTIEAGSVRLALAAAAVDLGPLGRDDQFGAGRVNAFAALRAIAGQ